MHRNPGFIALHACYCCCCFFNVLNNVWQAKVSFSHLLILYRLVFRFQMNSILFLVAASTLFHSVWPCNFYIEGII